MKLNRDTAARYVLEHLVGLGYEDVVIIEAIPMKLKSAPPMVVVNFTFRCEEAKDGVYRGGFDVWIEGDKLYGEW